MHCNFILMVLFMLLFISVSDVLAADVAEVHDLDDDTLRLVMPTADHFKRDESSLFATAHNKSDEIIGRIGLTTDVSDIVGYSGLPIVSLVGIDGKGIIQGVEILEHSEPILLLGIPEQEIFDFLIPYKGMHITDKISIGRSNDPKAVEFDSISGATVTALMVNEAILETSFEIGIESGLVTEADQTRGEFVADEPPWAWQEMVEEGAIGYLQVPGFNPEIDPPLLDLWFTIADAPQIGRTLLGDTAYEWNMERLKEKEHLVVFLSTGDMSFKGTGFARSGIFERIRILQGHETTIFRDVDYTNLARIIIEGAPTFREAGLFIAREGKIDPAKSFDVSFIVSQQQEQKSFSREFSSVDGSLKLPNSVYRVIETQRAGHGNHEFWKAQWQQRQTDVIASVIFYIIVGLILVFRRQVLGTNRRENTVQSVVLLASCTLFGFYFMAQLSIVQLVVWLRYFFGTIDLSVLLMEPVLFVTWIAAVILILAFGKGAYCGWLCPYGALTELIFKVGRWLRLPVIDPSDQVEKSLDTVKYTLLLAIILTTFVFPKWGSYFADIEPFKYTFLVSPWSQSALVFTWWTILLIASIVMFRPFCRYICPLAGGLALIGMLSRFDVRRYNRCQKCKVCAKDCDVHAIDHDGHINKVECTLCMRCINNYHDQNRCPELLVQQKNTQRNKAVQ
jgi:NosR/NirI family nitrous oxide reductase transcriptional regulator